MTSWILSAELQVPGGACPTSDGLQALIGVRLGDFKFLERNVIVRSYSNP
jgi:hypothetical protein